MADEIITVMAAVFTYPPFPDAYRPKLLLRPYSHQDISRAELFLQSSTLLADDSVEITDSSFAVRLQDFLLRFWRSLHGDQNALMYALAEQHAQALHKKIVRVVLDGAAAQEQSAQKRISWQQWNGAAPLSAPKEIVLALAYEVSAALAQLRTEEASAGAYAPRIEVSEHTADQYTVEIPVIESAAQTNSARHTAPLPEIMISAEIQDIQADTAIFTQLREQLLAAMQKAAELYGAPYAGSDPAGIIQSLREHNAIDESSLRMAEGILAVCGQVIAARRASLDEYRQAMILYLLFNRSRFSQP